MSTSTAKPAWVPHMVAWLLALFLSSLLVAVTLHLVWAEGHRAEQTAQRELSNMTRLTEEHAERTLRAADQALQLVRQLYLRDGTALNLAQWVQSGAIDAGVFHQVGIIDANGIFRLSNLRHTPPVDLSDREHFKVHLDHDRDELFVSKPVRGRVSGKWTIQLTRHIKHADGRFAGVAVVSLDADYFSRFYGGLDIGPRGMAGLVGFDGVVRARKGASPEADGVGVDLTGSALHRAVLSGAGPGFLDAPSHFDKLPRLHHFRRLDGFALYVVAALASEDYRASALETQRMEWLQALTGSGLLFGLAALYSWHRRREDITMHRVQACENFSRLALESAGVGAWVWNIADRSFDVDDRMFAMLGYRPHEVPANHQTFVTHFHPDDLRRLGPALIAVLKGQTARFFFEYRMRHKDGSWRWLTARGQVIERDANGRALRLTGINADRTDRRLAEEQQRVAAVAFASSAAMAISAADQTILRVNPAFEALSGYSAAEVIGRHSNIMKSGRQSAEFYRQMWAALNGPGGHWEGELWNRRKDGTVFPDWLAITAVRDSQGQVTHYVAVHSDITLRKRSDEEIRKLAFYDPLTGLPNRRLLLDRLEQARATLARHGQICAVLFMDLDHFKQLNDSHGHALGDELLVTVTRRLQDCVREGDTVARIGGDEFVVALTQLGRDAPAALASARVVANKICDTLGQPVDLSGVSWQVSVSVGLVLVQDAKQSVEDMLKAADAAMYAAKAAGRNTVHVAT